MHPETAHLLKEYIIPLYYLILIAGLAIWLSYNFKRLLATSPKKRNKFLTWTCLIASGALFIPHCAIYMLKLFTN